MTGLPAPSSIISSKHTRDRRRSVLISFDKEDSKNLAIIVVRLFGKAFPFLFWNYPFGKRIDWSSVSSKLYELCNEQ